MAVAFVTIGVGVSYSLTSVIAAIPAGIFEGRHYGTIFGTLMLAAIAAGAVGPWVSGLLATNRRARVPKSGIIAPD